MSDSDPSLLRIDADTEVLLEKHVFDHSERFDRRVLGDAVRFTGKSRSGHVAQIDAYVPRHTVGKDSAMRKTMRAHFEAMARLKQSQGPQVVPGVPTAAISKDSQPIQTIAACPMPYFGEGEARSNPTERLANFKGLLAALAEMHRNRLIHGNICEGSIRKESETDKPRLCDLALHCGSPTALPEEALLYHSAALRTSMVPDIDSDIYAAGMLGYRMLVGPEGPNLALNGSRSPLEDASLAAAVKRGPDRIVTADQFVGFSDGVAQKLSTILSRMIGAPGQNPYASVDELNAALNANDLGGPVPEPKTVVIEGKTWNGVTIAVAGLLSILAMGLAWFVWDQMGQIERLEGANSKLETGVQDLELRNGDLAAEVADLTGQGVRLRSEIDELNGISADLRARIEGLEKDVSDRSGKIADLTTTLRSTGDVMDDCLGDLALLREGLPSGLIWPALEAAQVRINVARNGPLEELAAACADRDRVLAMIPVANALDQARAALSESIDTARRSTFSPEYPAIDVTAAELAVQDTAQSSKDITARDLRDLVDKINSQAEELTLEIRDKSNAIAADLGRIRDAFSAPNDGLDLFLAPVSAATPDDQWAGLVAERDLIVAALRASGAALRKAFGNSKLEWPEEPLTISQSSVALDMLRSNALQELDRMTLKAQSLELEATALSGGLGLASISAANDLANSKNSLDVLERAGLLRDSIKGFEVLIAAANTDIESLRDSLVATRDRLIQRGMDAAGGALEEAFTVADASLEAFSAALESENLTDANKFSVAARDDMAAATTALRAADAEHLNAMRSNALLLARAKKAELSEFDIGWDEERLAELIAVLSFAPGTDVALSERLTRVEAANDLLTSALESGSSVVDRASESARAALEGLGRIDTSDALEILFEADRAKSDGRLLAAFQSYEAAIDAFMEMFEARSAPRDVTIGFRPEDLARIRQISPNQCRRCAILTQGAEQRSATVAPFELDRQEATYGDVSMAFSKIGRTPDAGSATHVGTVANGQMRWSKIGPYSFRELASRFPDLEPARGLSAADAQAYCQSVGKRLPTEEEWEYVASSATQKFFPWPEDEEPTVPWADIRWSDLAGSVGQRASPDGYVGMAGGSREWVTTADGFALKGGSYLSTHGVDLSIQARLVALADIAGDDHGVRCAVDLEQWQ